jgi:hypothetical protein
MARTLLVVVAGLSLSATFAVQGAAPPVEGVEVLVKRLASESYQEREAALRRLLSLGLQEPHPALLRALSLPDLELRRRVKQVLEDIRLRMAQVSFHHALEAGKRGQVDLFIDGLLDRPKGPDDDSWQAVVDLAWAVVDRSKLKARQLQGLPWRKFREYQEREHFAPPRPDGLIGRDARGNVRGLAWAEQVKAPEGIMGGSIVVSRDTVKVRSFVLKSIVLANGSMKCGSVTGTVVICDGDVTASSANESIIIARGDVRLSTRSPVHKCMILAGGKVTAGRNFLSVIKQKDRFPLDYIRFFDLAAVGLIVASAKQGARVIDVVKDTPFALSGVRPGDEILEASGTEVQTPEILRRLVRRALVRRGTLHLKVLREGKTVPVTIRLALTPGR